MFRTKLALALVALFAPSIASADEVAPGAPGAPGECTTCVAPAPLAKPADMQRRWGVSARAVSLSLAAAESEATKTEYGGGGIAASYRINRRWEIALELDALDAPEGPDLHSTSISARFHLTPHRRWDWYVVAGIGVLHEAPLEGEAHTDHEGRGRFHAGVGLARRWRYWSLAAELHGVAVAPKQEGNAMSTAHATTPPTAMSVDNGLSGGELTLAATFFF